MYGPTESSSSFTGRVESFIALNGEVPREEVLQAVVAQARVDGMGAGSLATSLKDMRPLMGRLNLSWSDYHLAQMLVNREYADKGEAHVFMDATVVLLVAMIATMPTVDLRSFCWLMLVTGCRAADAWLLTAKQTTFHEDSVEIEWHLRKAQQKRSQRHSEHYQYEWSSSPTPEVKSYLQKAKDLQITPERKSVATHINAAIKRTPIGAEHGWTSSVFRDHLQRVLDSKGLHDRSKALLDHSPEIATAHYSGKK
jgi:hypothetical protein